MRALARHLVVAATLLAVTGCASTRAIAVPSAENIQRQVEPGDVVKVAVKDGRTFEIEVEKVEADALTGTTIESRRFRIPYSTIATIEVQPDRTGAAVGAGGLIVLSTVAVLAAVIGFGDELWDHLTGQDDD